MVIVNPYDHFFVLVRTLTTSLIFFYFFLFRNFTVSEEFKNILNMITCLTSATFLLDFLISKDNLFYLYLPSWILLVEIITLPTWLNYVKTDKATNYAFTAQLIVSLIALLSFQVGVIGKLIPLILMTFILCIGNIIKCSIRMISFETYKKTEIHVILDPTLFLNNLYYAGIFILSYSIPKFNILLTPFSLLIAGALGEVYSLVILCFLCLLYCFLTPLLTIPLIYLTLSWPYNNRNNRKFFWVVAVHYIRFISLEWIHNTNFAALIDLSSAIVMILLLPHLQYVLDIALSLGMLGFTIVDLRGVSFVPLYWFLTLAVTYIAARSYPRYNSITLWFFSILTTLLFLGFLVAEVTLFFGIFTLAITLGVRASMYGVTELRNEYFEDVFAGKTVPSTSSYNCFTRKSITSVTILFAIGLLFPTILLICNSLSFLSKIEFSPLEPTSDTLNLRNFTVCIFAISPLVTNIIFINKASRSPKKMVVNSV